MSFQTLVKNNRSYRRFDSTHTIDKQILLDLVDLTRYAPSARNVQPLRYFLSNEKEMNDKIYPTLAWAGYLKDWNGPEHSERPSAYIVVAADTDSVASFTLFDAGLAIQNILLGAVEKGLGGCIIGSIHKGKLSEIIKLKDSVEIICVIALGKPGETIIVDEIKNGDFKYWRDAENVHHVPKRSLKDILL